MVDGVSNMKKETKLVVPVKKPRNPNVLSPLMHKGGAFNDPKKGTRRKENAKLSNLKDTKSFSDADDYGFNP